MANKFKVGNRVEWVCNNRNSGESFKCSGIIESFKMSVWGSKKAGMGAKILVKSKKYIQLYGRKNAFISVGSLTVVQ